MGKNSVRGEGTHGRVEHAGELGWDESLYGDDTSGGTATDRPGVPGRAGGPEGSGAAGGHDAPPAAGARSAREPASKPEPEPGSASDGGRSGKGGRRRRSKRKHRIVKWTAIALALLILGTAGAGYLYYQHLNGNIRKGDRSAGGSDAKKAAPNAQGQTPLNILLIGSDSRNTDANVALGGAKDNRGSAPHADVQMLLHVSADRKNASVVSIPRDTRVNIPECKDPDTNKVNAPTDNVINEALGRGGAGCVLDTWEKLTGIYIDHWMMVDFAGVVAISDAVGGADVCVKQNIDDHPTKAQPGGSHLHLTAGNHTVKGEQALQWLRTRHAFGSDIGRSEAQHMYMNSVIRNLKDQNAFTDTGRLMDIAETATKSLQVSSELGTVKKLFDLGMELKDIPMDRINMLTMPRLPDPKDPDAHVVPDTIKADALWALLRDDKPLDGKDDGKSGAKPSATPAKGPAAAAPGSLAVTVVNGTGTNGRVAVKGRATEVVTALKAKGFAKSATGSSDPAAASEVDYPKGAGAQGKADAESVATALGLPTSAVKATDVKALTLVVGGDWRTGDSYPKSNAKASDPLKDTETVNGADKGACMEVYAPYRF
ncbi:LCP family protein [Streptomyces sp. NBC_00083]|uniref:LCP family protein n=1 Tax=Streptomyces sp. NBC_00083 TaxID=2975647 RepID=UPI0022509ED8|nr:LCP family protein [Streptomyces sp. NBC_00083]MCX5382078.1 LCP family protein [Streptomyces sp. NBC_00083]